MNIKHGLYLTGVDEINCKLKLKVKIQKTKQLNHFFLEKTQILLLNKRCSILINFNIVSLL